MGIVKFFEDHGTKIIGAVGGSIGAIATTGVIPAKYLPYAMAVVGLCTFWRGFINSAASK